RPVERMSGIPQLEGDRQIDAAEDDGDLAAVETPIRRARGARRADQDVPDPVSRDVAHRDRGAGEVSGITTDDAHVLVPQPDALVVQRAGRTRNCEQRAGEAESAGQQFAMRERHGTSLRKLLLRDVMLGRSPTYAARTQVIRPATAGDAFLRGLWRGD